MLGFIYIFTANQKLSNKMTSMGAALHTVDAVDYSSN
jgi:hypothetical protein